MDAIDQWLFPRGSLRVRVPTSNGQVSCSCFCYVTISICYVILSFRLPVIERKRRTPLAVWNGLHHSLLAHVLVNKNLARPCHSELNIRRA